MLEKMKLFSLLCSLSGAAARSGRKKEKKLRKTFFRLIQRNREGRFFQYEHPSIPTSPLQYVFQHIKQPNCFKHGQYEKIFIEDQNQDIKMISE